MGAPATIVLFGIQTSERAPRRSGTYLIRCDSPSNTGPRHADLPEAPICSAPHNRTLFHRLPYLTWSATLCRFVTTTPPCCPCISFILIPLFRTDTAPPHSCPLAVQQPFTVSISPQSSSFLARTPGNVLRRAVANSECPVRLDRLEWSVSSVSSQQGN